MDIEALWKEKKQLCKQLSGAVCACNFNHDVNFEVLSDKINSGFALNTKFQAASLSKLVGTIVCAIFLERIGKSLDFSLENKLLIPVLKQTNLKHIFSHSAGINVSGFPGYEKTSLTKIQDIITGQNGTNTEAVKQSLPLGKYSYSGGGYCLAQEYIERLSHKKINKLADELLFCPLSLVNTTFNILKSDTNCAVGHNSRGEKIGTLGWHLYPETIAAGLWTTPCEYLKILNELIKGYYNKSEIISSAIAKEILTPFVDCEEDEIKFKYGLGVRYSENIHWHSGSNKGYKSFFAFDLNNKKAFVIMSNDDNAEDIFSV